MDTSKVVISKLNGSSYLVWATQIEALLQARYLWQYVGPDEVSVPDTDAAGIAAASKAKNMARAVIVSSIESEYVPMVAGEKGIQS